MLAHRSRMIQPRPTPPGRPLSLEESPESTAYSPPTNPAPGSEAVRVGGAVLRIASGAADMVLVALEGEPKISDAFECARVTHWCAETSVLLEVTLDLAAGDEVRIRGPMLVGREELCVAFARKITRSQSELFVGLAESPAAMAREDHLAGLEVSATEGRRLVATLRSAADAARPPHDARS